MEREKAAVDYGRNCDRRIAELEAQISQHEKPNMAPGTDGPLPKTLSERKGDDHTPAAPPELAKRLEGTTAAATELFARIQGLLTELASRGLLEQDFTKDDPLTSRLAKLEAIALMAREGLARELRIVKKTEPDLDESILISDGDDLIPARWLPLRKALQALDGLRCPNAKGDPKA